MPKTWGPDIIIFSLLVSTEYISNPSVSSHPPTTLLLQVTFMCCPVTQSCLTLWPHGLQHARLPCSPTISLSLFKLMSFELVMPPYHLILCHPLLLLPSIFPSIRVFPNESALHIRWPKYWSISFSISPSNEYSGFISFRIDWLDLLAVQRTLKSLLQHQSSKALLLWHSAFFIVWLSHPYMTTGKTLALTIWTFVDKVMSLLFNTLSRFIIAFLPRSKRLNFMAAVTVHSDLDRHV